MWIDGKQYKNVKPNFTSIVKERTGSMDDLEARITLIKFLKENIGWTYELITATKLFPIQEIILKGLFKRDNALIIAGRGVGKSKLIADFAILYPIFNYKSKLCLISSNFRNAREIFDRSEKLVRGKGAELLASCYEKEPNKRNDKIVWELPNGSSFFSLPLAGDGIRGTRASCVCVDEARLVPKEIQDNILRPFLASKQNYLEESKIREREDQLIGVGAMTEEDRISFIKNQYHMFSSSSYEFEHLYKVYQNYIEAILKGTTRKEDPTYLVIRASYEAVPADDTYMDLGAIESAKADGGEHTDYFKREYRALFSSGNDGYFDIEKIKACTHKIGEEPTTQIRGKKDCSYILTIDPSYAANKSSDFFAMGVFLIDYEGRKISQVHSYGRAGLDIKEHYDYLTYLLKAFNIVWLTIDASGSEFIDSYNESTIAQEASIKLNYVEVDPMADGYPIEINNLKKQYNAGSKHIVYKQKFLAKTNQVMNESLQTAISDKKVWFGSRTSSDDHAFSAAKKDYDYLRNNFNFSAKNKHGEVQDDYEFIEEQDNWIEETQGQMSLIEQRPGENGIMRYDLPRSMKNLRTDNRPRRDNYTCVLMANYSAKLYFDMLYTQSSVQRETFTPFFAG